MSPKPTKTTDGAIVYARIQGFKLSARDVPNDFAYTGGWKLKYPDGVTWRPFGTAKEAVGWLRARARNSDTLSPLT